MGYKYENIIKFDNPVAYWPCSDASSPLVDEIGSISMTPSNSLTFQSDSLIASEPTALSVEFTGNNLQYASIPITSFLDMFSGSWTIAFMLKIPTSETDGSILSINDENDSSLGKLALFFDSGNFVDCHITDSAGSTTQISDNISLLSNDHVLHYVLTYNSITEIFSIYRQGYLVGIKDFSAGNSIAVTNTSDDLIFGSYWANGTLNNTSKNIQMNLSHVAFYSKSFSPEHVKAHVMYAEHMGRNTKSLHFLNPDKWAIDHSYKSTASVSLFSGESLQSTTTTFTGLKTLDSGMMYDSAKECWSYGSNFSSSSIFTPGSQTTFMVWFKLNSTPSGLTSVFRSDNGIGVIFNGSELRIAANTSSQLIILNSGQFKTNIWYNIVFILDPGDFYSVYLNGDPYLNGTFREDVSYSASSLNNPFAFHVRQYPGQSINNSRVHDFAVFRRKLTRDEIQWCCNMTNPDVTNNTDYSDMVYADNPRCYFRLNESSGVTATNYMIARPDACGDATYVNTPTLNKGTGLVSDLQASSIGLDVSVPEYVDLGTNILENNPIEFTVEAMIRPTNIATASNDSIIFMATDGAATEFYIGIQSSGELLFRFNGLIAITTSSALSDNVWYLIQFCYRKDYFFEIFVNGSLFHHEDYSSSTTPPSNWTSGNSLFGTNGAVVNTVNFDIAETAVYPRAFTLFDAQRHYGIAQNDYVYPTDMYNMVIQRIPLLYWRMNNNKGDVVSDSSANNYNGNVNGLVNRNQDSSVLYEKYNSSLVFSGTNSYITRSSLTEISGDFTICFWFKGSEVATGKTLIEQYNNSGGFYIEIDALGIRFVVRHDASNVFIAQNTSETSNYYQDGNWHFCSGIFSKGISCDLYIDGNNVSDTKTGTIGNIITSDSTEDFYVGSSGGTSQFYSGSIDEVVVFDYVLREHEIYELNLMSYFKEKYFNYEISGVTQVQGVLDSCDMFLYESGSGNFIERVVSDGVTGSYTFTDLDWLDYDIVCNFTDPGVKACSGRTDNFKPTLVSL